MRTVEQECASTNRRAFKSAANAKRPGGRKALSPLTLRLTPEERAALEEMARGTTLSAYVRGRLFERPAKHRKRRAQAIIGDKRAVAEALSLLGQSRIASNLKQLAHHANMGLLFVGDLERAQIAEANAHLAEIRSPLLAALAKPS